MLIVGSRAPAPDQPTSELLTEVYDPRVSRIVCIAAVLEGSGFWASGIRSKSMHSALDADQLKAVLRAVRLLGTRDEE